MLSPLLATKLGIPILRTDLVPRPRLIARLNDGLGRKLTLVSAPAGSGKTTLLAAWARECNVPIAWLSLDGDENDPVRFFNYFIAALRTVLPGLGERALAYLGPSRQSHVKSFLTALINEVSAEERSFVLVLDDYHLITSAAVHEAVGFWIEHQPQSMHVVILSRADPSIPLVRFRARGQLNEVRERDLNFNNEEVRVFFNQVMQLDLTMDEVAAMEARTEGWAVGLQLAALSMLELPDRHALIREFSGGSRYILDYLGNEVLNRQEASVRSFLLSTSILERLSAPLCDALTRRNDCQELLQSLEDSHLFIVPLDAERHWYRYHRLFADFLRKVAASSMAEDLPGLHQLASAWHRAHGYIDEAIQHAIVAKDYQTAVELIHKDAASRLMRNEAGTLLHWIDSLPEQVVSNDPGLCLHQAWALTITSGDIDLIEARLNTVEEFSPHDSLLGSLHTLRGLIAVIRNDLMESEHHLVLAQDLLPEEDLFLRSMAADNLGMIQTLKGDLDAAVESFERAAEISHHAGNLLVAVGALTNMAGIWMMQGQLRRARLAYQRALKLGTDSRGRYLPVAGKALLGLGSIAREWNEFESSRDYLTECIVLFEEYLEVGSVVAYLTLARIEVSEGNVDAAQELVDRARQVAIDFDASKIDDELVDTYQAQLWILQGDLSQAMHWIEQHELVQKFENMQERGVHPMQAHQYLVLTRFYIAQARFENGLRILEAIIRGATYYKNRRTGIQAEVLQALIYHMMGNTDKALVILEKALLSGESEGYLRVFLDEGEPMLRLLYQAAERRIRVEYVKRLLHADNLPSVSMDTRSQEGLIEPLSERELEVLQLIESGLSNQEIARELVIALSTVKGHIANIYGKLEVRSRTQALARARQLGILGEF